MTDYYVSLCLPCAKNYLWKTIEAWISWPSGYKQRKTSLPSRYYVNVWPTGTSQNPMDISKYQYLHHFLCPDMKVANCRIDSTGLWRYRELFKMDNKLRTTSVLPGSLVELNEIWVHVKNLAWTRQCPKYHPTSVSLPEVQSVQDTELCCQNGQQNNLTQLLSFVLDVRIPAAQGKLERWRGGWNSSNVCGCKWFINDSCKESML